MCPCANQNGSVDQAASTTAATNATATATTASNNEALYRFDTSPSNTENPRSRERMIPIATSIRHSTPRNGGHKGHLVELFIVQNRTVCHARYSHNNP
jgi:hypothetical protein